MAWEQLNLEGKMTNENKEQLLLVKEVNRILRTHLKMLLDQILMVQKLADRIQSYLDHIIDMEGEK